jgi:membrane protease YdiL (CAAX protease family)
LSYGKQILSTIKHLAIVCVALILACGSTIRAAAQEPESEAAAWLARQTWQQKYKVCFDPHGQPLPDKLRDLVAEVEARRAAIGDTSSWEQLALLNTLEGAHRNLREWQQAEASAQMLLATLTADRARMNTPQAQAQADWYRWLTNKDLAGISGMQQRWGIAVHSYLTWVWLEAVQYYAPYVGVAYGVLVLWWLTGWTNPTVRAARWEWFWLALFAASPLLFLLIVLGTNLIASAFLDGNPFANLALEPLYPRNIAISSTVWVVLLLGFSIGFRRSQWWHQKPGDEGASSTDTVTASAMSLRKSRRLMLYAAVMLLGWALHHVNNERWFVNVAFYLPENLAWWRNTGRADADWIYNTVFKVTVGSWVEELFFRGILYAYARRIFGVGFAMVFSASVFAAWHGPYDQFLYHFWGGIVFAVQYEVSGSLIPSTVTHSLHNLLVYVGSRP